MESEIFKYICASQGSVDAEELMFNLFPDKSSNDVISNQEKFVIYFVNGKQKVVARTSLRLCKHKDCPGTCRRLHLCKAYLFSGVCQFLLQRRFCRFSHDLTSDHNRKVLEEHKLEALSRVELCTLLLQNDQTLLPSICHDYNNGDWEFGQCQNGFACESLHICEKYPRQNCICYRNHDFYAPPVLKIFHDKGVPLSLISSLRPTYANKEALRATEYGGARGHKGKHNPAVNNVDAKSGYGVNLAQRQWYRGRGGNRGNRGNRSNRGNSRNGSKPGQQQERSSISDITSHTEGLDLFSEDGLDEGNSRQPNWSSSGFSMADADAKSDDGLNVEKRQQNQRRGRGGNRGGRGGSRGNIPQPSFNEDSNFDDLDLFSKNRPDESFSQQEDLNSSNSDVSAVGNDTDTSITSGQGKQQSTKQNQTSAVRGRDRKQDSHRKLSTSDISAAVCNKNGNGDEASRKPRQIHVKDKTEICMYFIKGNCRHEDRCFKAHDKMPYRWQVQEGGQWTDLPDNETIEEDYCDPKNTYSTSSPPVHFDTMKLGENKVRRLSTLNSLVEPTFIHTTEWLWYWQDENGMWKLYGSDSGTHGSADINSATLEQKFLDNSDDEVEFSAGSQSYSLSFRDMIQTNKQYSTKRLVSRRPRFVSASDVRTKKFRRPLYSAPENWDKTKIPATGFMRVDLQRSSEEFQKVEALFSSTMQGFDIIKIERIQNKALWEVFQWQKNRMRDSNGGRYVSEKQLFHGTDSQHVDAICSDNFDWRICGTHGTAFGKGSYFARDAKYSDSYTGHMNDKTMFVSRVLVGRYTKGDPSYVRPPPKNDETNYYNSCVNDVKDPSIYVVFEKHQIYPEYLLKYKTKDTKYVSGTSVSVQKPKPILKPVPVAKPAISPYQPSTSSYLSSTSSYQPSTSSYQPSTPSYLSSTSSYQPSTSSYQPSTPSYLSSTSSYQPSTSSYQPSTPSYLSSASSYPPGISYLPSTPSHLSSTSSSSTVSSQNHTSSSSSVYKVKAEPKKSSDSCIIV